MIAEPLLLCVIALRIQLLEAAFEAKLSRPAWCIHHCGPWNCTDIAPPGNDDCAAIAEWGKCNDGSIKGKGYCCASCCNAFECRVAEQCGNKCTDEPPPMYVAIGDCDFLRRQGRCGITIMENFCCASFANYKKCDFVGACQEVGVCTDEQPEGNNSTCQQQAEWDKCGEWWMKGKCCKTCTTEGKCRVRYIIPAVATVLGLVCIGVLVFLCFSCRRKSPPPNPSVPFTPASPPTTVSPLLSWNHDYD